MFSKKHKQMTGMISTDVHIDVIQRNEGLYESGLFVTNPVQLVHFQPTFSYGGTVMNAQLFHQVRASHCTISRIVKFISRSQMGDDWGITDTVHTLIS